jgi:aspartyl/asparaginyl beta-hydroxylase (cupin superfamily)
VIRRVSKAFKKRNRKLYYAAKWTLLIAILAAIFVPWRML